MDGWNRFDPSTYRPASLAPSHPPAVEPRSATPSRAYDPDPGYNVPHPDWKPDQPAIGGRSKWDHRGVEEDVRKSTSVGGDSRPASPSKPRPETTIAIVKHSDFKEHEVDWADADDDDDELPELDEGWLQRGAEAVPAPATPPVAQANLPTPGPAASAIPASGSTQPAPHRANHSNGFTAVPSKAPPLDDPNAVESRPASEESSSSATMPKDVAQVVHAASKLSLNSHESSSAGPISDRTTPAPAPASKPMTPTAAPPASPKRKPAIKSKWADAPPTRHSFSPFARQRPMQPINHNPVMPPPIRNPSPSPAAPQPQPQPVPIAQQAPVVSSEDHAPAQTAAHTNEAAADPPASTPQAAATGWSDAPAQDSWGWGWDAPIKAAMHQSNATAPAVKEASPPARPVTPPAPSAKIETILQTPEQHADTDSSTPAFSPSKPRTPRTGPPKIASDVFSRMTGIPLADPGSQRTTPHR